VSAAASFAVCRAALRHHAERVSVREPPASPPAIRPPAALDLPDLPDVPAAAALHDGTSAANPETADPEQADPDQSNPDQAPAGPEQAPAGPDQAGPDQAGPDQAGPDQADPDQAVPVEAVPGRSRLHRYLADTARGLVVMAMVTILSLAAWVIVPLLWGWDAYTVTTGSMAPLVRPGDVVLAANPDTTTDVALGTVVVLTPPPERTDPITHRIVEHLPDGRYRTKGDANLQPDTRLITADQIIGQVRVVVPLAGQVQIQLGKRAPMIGVGVIIASLLIPLIRRRRRKKHDPPTNPPRTLLQQATPTAVVCLLIVTITTAGTSWTTTRANWQHTTSTPTNGYTTSDFYYPAMITSAPVSYWRLGGSNTTTATDEMGVANLTLTNTPVVQQPGALRGDPDKSIGFRRTPSVSYASVANVQHQFAGNMTVAAWVKATNVNNLWRVVFKGVSGNLNYLLAWSANGADMRFLVDLATTTRLTAIGAYPQDGGWHFAVGVYDNTAARVYVDGVEKGTFAGSGPLRTSAQALTLSENSASTGMIGDVDEVALWNRALSPTEIAHLYVIGKP
jgi:signal peptidase